MSQKFIDLDRSFVPVGKNDETEIEWSKSLGRRLGGWLSWDDLLQTRRTVILAEAQCGKTEELKAQYNRLRSQKKAAFFVRIEQLAAQGARVLEVGDDGPEFGAWKGSPDAQAWFFLDSVDEARINGQMLETALDEFRFGLGVAGLSRAYVVITCRVSDWFNTSDRKLVQEKLPYVAIIEPSRGLYTDEEFLAPIFDRSDRQRGSRNADDKYQRSLSEICVVKLAPLDHEQQKVLAESRGLDSEKFLESLYREGLSHFAERPGDFLELIASWKGKSCFGRLRDMVEEGISLKLKARAYRVDSKELTPKKAREGIERLAGAMTFGKTFSIVSPAGESDPSLTQDAIDAFTVLTDWSRPSVEALLRTGLFAPATYGRIRFHHRMSQEYLTASWLRTLLKNNCSISVVKSLLFAKRYEVETVVHGLEAVLAWLAQWSPEVLDELIRLEPLLLIVHGDPRSLPLTVRSSLLTSYARLDAQGALLQSDVDARAAWMFSSPDLASAVRSAWIANDRPEFREELASFIEQGPIVDCLDLVRARAIDEDESERLRLACIDAIMACKDMDTAKQLRKLLESPEGLGDYFLSRLTAALYPVALSAEELCAVIKRCWPASKKPGNSFGAYLAIFHNLSKTRSDQVLLIDTVGELLRLNGALDEAELDFSYLDSDHYDGVAALAVCELEASGHGRVSDGMLSLLAGVERLRPSYASDTSTNKLRSLIAQNKPLNRQLLWLDESLARARDTENPPTTWYRVGPHGEGRLWRISESDIAWLTEDARSMPLESQRRLAFNAVFQSAYVSENWEAHKEAVAKLAASDAVLLADFNDFTTPRLPQDYELRERRRQSEWEVKEQKRKQSWLDFRAELQANPSVLDAPGDVNARFDSIFHLTDWLNRSAEKPGRNGMVGWSRLARAFSKEVAEHYASGMRFLWREVTPERPAFNGESSYSRKWVTKLAIDGLELESLTPGWTDSLSEEEVKLAMRHVVLAGSVTSSCAHDLIKAKPKVVTPIIEEAVLEEFHSDGVYSDILQAHAYRSLQELEQPLASEVAAVVFGAFAGKEPSRVHCLERCCYILRRSAAQVDSKKLKALVQRRLRRHLNADDEQRAFLYIGMMAWIDADAAIDLILTELSLRPSESMEHFELRAERWVGALFENRSSGGHACAVLGTASTPMLMRLVKVAYQFVRREDDLSPEEEQKEANYVRRQAEWGRGALLSALWERPGGEAYQALLTLVDDELFAHLAHRLKEQAHKKAQIDSATAPWTEAESYEFNERHIAPVKTGADLLDLTLSILDDVCGRLRSADASSWNLLCKAEVEEEVQEWLFERLLEKSRGRYVPHRETQVADGNAPDIIVSADAAPVEIAIEVKHGNKKEWTVRKLEKAITTQLAEKYLRPHNRRHGIFVVSLHSTRPWRVDGENWDFERLIDHLHQFAKTVTKNQYGPIEVRVVGIDARRQSP